MNEHQLKIIELLKSKPTSVYRFEFRGWAEERHLPILTKALVDLGEQGYTYFLRVEGPNWVRYFKRRRFRED
jgi:hypothetical protein